MPKIGVNLTAVEKLQVLPDGTYLLEILPSSSVKRAKTSDIPKICWVCSVLEGEYDGSRAYFETSLAPDALWKVLDIVEALGLSYDEDGFELDDAYGRRVLATLGSHTYEERIFQDGESFQAVETKKRGKK